MGGTLTRHLTKRSIDGADTAPTFRFVSSDRLVGGTLTRYLLCLLVSLRFQRQHLCPQQNNYGGHTWVDRAEKAPQLPDLAHLTVEYGGHTWVDRAEN